MDLNNMEPAKAPPIPTRYAALRTDSEDDLISAAAAAASRSAASASASEFKRPSALLTSHLALVISTDTHNASGDQTAHTALDPTSLQRRFIAPSRDGAGGGGARGHAGASLGSSIPPPASRDDPNRPHHAVPDPLRRAAPDAELQAAPPVATDRDEKEGTGAEIGTDFVGLGARYALPRLDTFLAHAHVTSARLSLPLHHHTLYGSPTQHLSSITHARLQSRSFHPLAHKPPLLRTLTRFLPSC